ncbi:MULTISPECIES: M23 family metallopeptidase [Acinetobacter]|jgi:murein DD-endopeptidase MepM/ murein hydrolase activator NlpD|uniref:M23 family metallopeptidase n=1 Tax=Acinetobacter radioresistens TaxID=40216 RepID=A0A8H2K0Z9_ACIRA|nr:MULTISPECIES: M23 family metallopeptidase [Acinetobacter]EXB73413.1 peptidase M23 family protein [Acinetobacter sp. 230853]EXC34576.1 peptidase M23 family protein [Acinetobacter sp. 869535]EXE14972.1 peptidase M23 family protein [Acinetobacter sp. 983759]KCX39522.1 peptidase M23 family protein [Acinetobacter sp. 263903-1]TNX91725.1 M23 family metallopeptidase [Acinetobacter radioresistens]
MHTRRILLAFSLAASAASVAFADLVELNGTTSSPDRLEELTRTLAQGSYSQPDDINIPANTNVSITLREKTVELNNESLAKKYGTKTTPSYNSSNPYSWLVSHPLPDMKRVSSNYGGRVMGGRAENHSGLDLSAPSGTPIYATGPGIVTKSGWGTGYGQYVEINHGNGYLTRYAHASRLVARVGDRVEAGEHIANVGCTGRCTGPHLHYEVVKDGQRKNPSTYLAMLP